MKNNQTTALFPMFIFQWFNIDVQWPRPDFCCFRWSSGLSDRIGGGWISMNFHWFLGVFFLKKNQMNTNGVAEAPSTSMLKAASFQDRNCWSNVMEGFHVREWTYTEGVVSNRASRQLVEKYFTLGKWHQFTSSTEKSSPNSFTRKIDDWKIGFPFGT